MFKHRLLSTMLLSALTVLAIFFHSFFIVVILLLTFGGLYEFFALVEKKGVPVYKYFGTIVGLIIPLSIFYRFELTKGWELLFITIGLITLFVLQISKKSTSQAVFSISSTIFGILYIPWLFSFIVKLKMLPDGGAFVGALVLITKASDAGAYLVGSRFGKHALLSEISPKKSFEGALGSVIFGIVAAVLSGFFLPKSLALTLPQLITIGFSLSILGLLGDLSESLIKRDCIAKDSSKLFPGIGGVLDVIDSLLFTAPVFYFYIYRLVV